MEDEAGSEGGALDEVKGPPKNDGRFKKGVAPNPTGKTGARLPTSYRQLRDMRLIYDGKGGRRKTPGFLKLREMFENDFKTFKTQLDMLERAVASKTEASTAQGCAVESKEVDEGAERAIEACRRLLAKWRAERTPPRS